MSQLNRAGCAPYAIRFFYNSELYSHGRCHGGDHITDLIYPPLCVGCGTRTTIGPTYFLSGVPASTSGNRVSSPCTTILLSLISPDAYGCNAGASFLFFSRGGGTQRMLHQIKYNNQPDLITTIGRWYGKQLLNADLWKGIDVIVPVPLHWRKQRKRGYNQSAVLARRWRCHGYTVSSKGLAPRHA